MEDTKIIENKELNIWEALTPVLVLIGLAGLQCDGVWRRCPERF